MFVSLKSLQRFLVYKIIKLTIIYSSVHTANVKQTRKSFQSSLSQRVVLSLLISVTLVFVKTAWKLIQVTN